MAHVERRYHHNFISDALVQQWSRIANLREEIRRYRPPTEEQLRDDIEVEFTRMRAMDGNSHCTDGDLREFVKRTLFGLGLPDANRTGLQYGPRVMTEYTSVTVLSHVLCEAIINEVMAYGLGTKGATGLFSFIESGKFIDKWVKAPKAFAPDYVLPKGSGMYETLHRLNKHRNLIAHHKIALVIDGQEIFEGANLDVGDIAATFDWMHRFVSLPYDLTDHIKSHIGTEFVTPAIRRGSVPRAPQHPAIPKTENNPAPPA